jgi:transcriptional regulator with XRE-family HTH domain
MTRNQHPGGRIRSLRQSQGRTLDDIATVCGFTPSLLSKIETGATSPPVATLTAIAGALGVPVAGLLGIEALPAAAVHDPAASRNFGAATDKGYRFAALAASRGATAMTPYLFTAERGKMKTGPLAHAGEELVMVLSGELRYRVGPVEYHLREGDVLAFDSAVDHDMEPVSERATWFAVFCAAPSAAKAKPVRSRKA